MKTLCIKKEKMAVIFLMACTFFLMSSLPASAENNTALCPFNWTRDLAFGSVGTDVRALQQFLNSNSATLVAVDGSGSKGNETVFYGPATQQAVKKFQSLYFDEVIKPLLPKGPGGISLPTAEINFDEIDPHNGSLSSLTRAKINKLCSNDNIVNSQFNNPVNIDPVVNIRLLEKSAKASASVLSYSLTFEIESVTHDIHMLGFSDYLNSKPITLLATPLIVTHGSPWVSLRDGNNKIVEQTDNFPVKQFFTTTFEKSAFGYSAFFRGRTLEKGDKGIVTIKFLHVVPKTETDQMFRLVLERVPFFLTDTYVSDGGKNQFLIDFNTDEFSTDLVSLSGKVESFQPLSEQSSIEIISETPTNNFLDLQRKDDLSEIASAMQAYFTDNNSFKVTDAGWVNNQGKATGIGWFSYQCKNNANCRYPQSIAKRLHDLGYTNKLIADPTGIKATSVKQDQSGYMIYVDSNKTNTQSFTIWANLDNPTVEDFKTLKECKHSTYDHYSKTFPESRQMNYCVSGTATVSNDIDVSVDDSKVESSLVDIPDDAPQQTDTNNANPVSVDSSTNSSQSEDLSGSGGASTPGVENQVNNSADDLIRKADLQEIATALNKRFSATGTYKLEGAAFKGLGNGWFSQEGTNYATSAANALLTEGYASRNIVDPSGVATSDSSKDQSGYMIHTGTGFSFTVWANLDNPTVEDKETLNNCALSTYDNYLSSFPESRQMNYCVSGQGGQVLGATVTSTEMVNKIILRILVELLNRENK